MNKALFDDAVRLHQAGRLAEAESACRQILAADPSNPGANQLLGIIHFQQGRYQEALEFTTEALTQRPNTVPVLVNHGLVLHALSRFEEALTAFDRALAARPDHALAWNNRGNTLLALHRPAEAVRSFDRAVALKPDFFEAWFHRAIALYELGQDEPAITNYDQALALRPDSISALNNRGWALIQAKRFADAARDYRRLEDLLPGSPLALNGAAFCASQLCDWSRQDEVVAGLRKHIEAGSPHIKLGTLIAYNDDPALQRQCARNIVAALPPQAPVVRATAFAGDKIRLAYCSADFLSHPVPRLLAGMFEAHDRNRFEVIAISYSIDDKSPMRARLTQAFDQFHDVLEFSDHDIAQRIADLNVDIAIDLMGHTTRARPAIFAARPAPVQVNYMGYPGTMATAFHDYILADAMVLPMDQQTFYTEKIVHLPDSYFGTDGTQPPAGPAPSRAAAGLPDEGFVFCCFNNNWKIGKDQFGIWMRLLAGVPGSVLWLLHDNDEVVDSLKRHASERGIDPGRLIFAPRVTHEEHLARHRLADLFLDTLPYNAHTTAVDALWVGVPVITCKGRSLYARVAASLLQAVGLGEMITDNLADYEALALALARDPPRLAALKQKLAATRTIAPLFDTARFTRAMETVFTTMRDIHRRGEEPQAFTVPR